MVWVKVEYSVTGEHKPVNFGNCLNDDRAGGRYWQQESGMRSTLLGTKELIGNLSRLEPGATRTYRRGRGEKSKIVFREKDMCRPVW